VAKTATHASRRAPISSTDQLSFSIEPVLEQFTRTADLTGAQKRLDHTVAGQGASGPASKFVIRDS